MTDLVKMWLALLLSTGTVTVGTVAYFSAVSPDYWVYEGAGQWQDIGPQPAPGPAIGAGLPFLLLIGSGWAARQYRRKAQ